MISISNQYIYIISCIGIIYVHRNILIQTSPICSTVSNAKIKYLLENLLAFLTLIFYKTFSLIFDTFRCNNHVLTSLNISFYFSQNNQPTE